MLPWLFFEILLKVPYGIFFVLSARSTRNKRKSTSYPEALTRAEQKGLLPGPLIYLREKRKLASLYTRHSDFLRLSAGG